MICCFAGQIPPQRRGFASICLNHGTRGSMSTPEGKRIFFTFHGIKKRAGRFPPLAPGAELWYNKQKSGADAAPWEE